MNNLMHCLNCGTCAYDKVQKFYFQYDVFKTWKIKIISLIIFLLLAPLTFSQNRIQIIDSMLTVYHKEGKLNGNVLLAEKGQIIYSRSFGFANQITKEKLSENSVFGLASVSKQFTAMAIAILKEQGKLNYDDKITKYLPELTSYDNIIIRNLLNHTSGFQDFEQLTNSREAKEYMSTRLVDNNVTNQNIVEFFSMYKPKLNFIPGTKFEYCDIGYVFLGSIIEKVSGLTYSAFLDKTIFKPLEMNNTFVYSPETTPDKINNYAWGYIYSESLKKYQSADSMNPTEKIRIMTDGASGIYSTVLDLLKWDRALYTEQLVSFSSLKEIFESSVLNDNTKSSYGFGWFLQEDPNYGKIAFHSGGDRGYATYMERHLDSDKFVIILGNYSPCFFPVDMISRNLYNLPLPKEVQLSQEQIQKIVGTYKTQIGPELRIWFENEQLFVQATGQKAVPIFAENELLLFAKAVDVKLQFEKNKQGKITRLFILKRGNKTVAEKK
jgi:CubicO group peptidase (beta-lactamase class C family)